MFILALVLVGLSSFGTYWYINNKTTEQLTLQVNPTPATEAIVAPTDILTANPTVNNSNQYSTTITLKDGAKFLLEFSYPSGWTVVEPSYPATTSFEISLTKGNDKIRMHNYILGFGGANGVSEVTLANITYLRILHPSGDIVYNRKDQKEGNGIISQVWVDVDEDSAAQMILKSLIITER